MWRHAVTALVVTLGFAAISLATEGFEVVTAEGARRLAVEAAPRSLPDVQMTDHLGRHISWSDFSGSTVLVEFIFTTCPSVCQKMTSDFRDLAADLTRSSIDPSVSLLSISFDPAQDTVDRLRQVAKSFGADGHRWRFARIDDEEELAATLETFGIVAIPSETFGFEHNAAIHGVNQSGRLAKIVDIDALASIRHWARSPEP